MKNDKKLKIQQAIIERQQKEINSLNAKINELTIDKNIRETSKDEGFENAKELIAKIEMDRIILKDAIAKARAAESNYNKLIKKAKPLVTEYQNKLHDLNKALDAEGAMLSHQFDHLKGGKNGKYK